MVKVIQISVGGFDNNFSYIVLGKGQNSKRGVLIDPTGNKDAIESELEKHNAKIKLQLFTHNHPDHTELFAYFKSKGIKSYNPKPASLGKKEFITVAGLKIEVIHTPGHTKEGVCFIIENNIFTGDTLFVRGIGTTAYGGNDKELTNTLNFLFTLNQNLILYPGHNYGGASEKLGAALLNSHLKPNEKILKLIKNKVAEYEAKQKNKF
ncbi:MAG: MBL fold metallo-hydrolase [archaeon]